MFFGRRLTRLYSDCLPKLNVIIENINSTRITVICDFNANLSKQSVVGDMLLNFCSDNNCDIVDKNYSPCRHVPGGYIHMSAQPGAPLLG